MSRDGLLSALAALVLLANSLEFRALLAKACTQSLGSIHSVGHDIIDIPTSEMCVNIIYMIIFSHILSHKHAVGDTPLYGKNITA